jgi:hypothetical protein
MNSVFVTVPSISKLLKGNREEGLRNMAIAYDYYEGAIKFVDKFLRMFYDFSNVNLAEVSKYLDKSSAKVGQDKDIIFALLHFLMGGDFFMEYKKYDEYLDFIKEPKQLARYQHYVMNRNLYKTTDCPTPFEIIFPMANSKM